MKMSNTNLSKNKTNSCLKHHKIELLSKSGTPPLKTIPFLTNCNIVQSNALISSSRVKELIDNEGAKNIAKINYAQTKTNKAKWKHHRYLSDMPQLNKLNYKTATKSTEESIQDRFWAMRTVL